MALIEIRGLCTVFGRRPAAALAEARAGADKTALLARGHTLALLDVDLDIAAGEIFVVMGLSGSGKSTLVRHVNRLIEPTAGQVRIDGADVLSLAPGPLRELRRQRMAMVFQDFGLHAHLTVLDNVAFGLEMRGLPRPQREERARHWVARVGLKGFEGHRPEHLSGGMRQRVGLARALATDADIILMDEPFSALDPLVRSRLQEELLRMQRELRRTIVFVTHDLDEALRLGDRLAILRDGRVVQVGAPQEVLLRPADAQVAEFVRDVNRARALRAGQVLEPWPGGTPVPAPEDRVDASMTIEQILPRLLRGTGPVAVQRDGEVVGALSTRAVLEALAAGPAPS